MDNDVTRRSCSFCGVQGERGMRFAGGFGAVICESCVDHYHDMLHTPAKSAAARKPPWDSMTDAEILAAIPQIATTADQVSQFLVEWVELARSRRISWAEIGKSLGISRQSAWERFASRVTEQPSAADGAASSA